MQEQSRYAVGIDIGTSMVRCVVGHIDGATGMPKIVGVGQAINSGMRRGIVTNLTGPAAAIDTALGEAERMSGHQINAATMSVNGTHIISTRADGMVAVGSQDGAVALDDIYRVEDVATTGKVPANREILEIIPHMYRLDGQDNIKDPIGMSGTRLEIVANVVSALSPHIGNVQKTAEMAKVEVTRLIPSVLASAQAVLSESQMENGVAVLDIGAATTGVAVFEDGDLQFMSVIPMGSHSVTKDLAIGLKIDPEIAELVKIKNGRLGQTGGETVSFTHDKKPYQFEQAAIDEVVEARCEELFELIQKELKKAGRAGKLPSGVVLTGGGARLAGIVEYAKEQLALSVKLGKPMGYAGVSDAVETPDFAAAIGLLIADAANQDAPHESSRKSKKTSNAVKKAGGLLSGLFNKFK